MIESTPTALELNVKLQACRDLGAARLKKFFLLIYKFRIVKKGLTIYLWGFERPKLPIQKKSFCIQILIYQHFETIFAWSEQIAWVIFDQIGYFRLF